MKKLLYFCIVIFALAPAYASASVTLSHNNSISLSSGLVGYWSFDGNTINWGSNHVADVSGSGNTGTLSNFSMTTAAVVGEIGQALKFNGTNSEINLSKDIPFGSSNFTISLWFKTTADSDTTNQQLWISGYDGNNPDLELAMAGDTGEFFARDASGADIDLYSTNNLNDGAWHQIVGVRQGNTFSLYVDGVLQGSQSAALGSVDTTSVAPTIGNGASYTNNRWFNGDIDDVRAYDRALSYQEVEQLYALGGVTMHAQSSSGGLSGSLTASWSFDTSTVSGSTVEDLSGNGHTLTLENGASITPGYSGDALTLDGTDQYAYGLIGSLPTSVALSMWVKANDVSTEQAILTEEGDGAPSSGYHFTLVGILNGKFYAGFWNIGDIAGLSPINAGQWYHVILTYDGVADTQSLYVDGVLQGTQSGVWDPPSDIYFLPGYQQSGCSFTSASGHCGDTAHYFNGQIDDLQGYDQAFTAQDVQSLNTQTVNIAHSNTTLSNGLVGYWTFDGSTINWGTGVVADKSGQGNNGQLINMSTTTSPVIGKIGQALKFNGTSQYISVPYASSLAPTAAISFGAWFYNTNVSQNARILSKTESGGYNLAFNDGSLTGLTATVHTSGGYFYVNDASIVNNAWYYGFVTYDGTMLRLYVNGVDVSNTSVTGGAITYADSNPLCIAYEPGASSCNGSGGSPGYFPGKIDDVRIYNRALSAQEISQLYLAGK